MDNQGDHKEPASKWSRGWRYLLFLFLAYWLWKGFFLLVAHAGTIEDVAREIAAQHNKRTASSQADPLLVSSRAHAGGRYVFVENTMRLKPNLSKEQRAEYRQELLRELLPVFCPQAEPALKMGVVWMVTYKSHHGQEITTLRVGAEECR